MAATSALKKIPTASVLGTLSERALKDADHRVRINALRALSAFEYNAIKATAFAALRDANSNVVIAAATLIDDLAIAPEEQHILQVGLEHNHPRIRASLLGTALSLTENKADIIDKIRQQYLESRDPYYKADLLTSLGHALDAHV